MTHWKKYFVRNIHTKTYEKFPLRISYQSDNYILTLKYYLIEETS